MLGLSSFAGVTSPFKSRDVGVFRALGANIGALIINYLYYLGGSLL